MKHPTNWRCLGDCKDLIALNIQAIQCPKEGLIFRCLYCGMRAAYIGYGLTVEKMLRKMGFQP